MVGASGGSGQSGCLQSGHVKSGGRVRHFFGPRASLQFTNHPIVRNRGNGKGLIACNMTIFDIALVVATVILLSLEGIGCETDNSF